MKEKALALYMIILCLLKASALSVCSDHYSQVILMSSAVLHITAKKSLVLTVQIYAHKIQPDKELLVEHHRVLLSVYVCVLSVGSSFLYRADGFPTIPVFPPCP